MTIRIRTTLLAAALAVGGLQTPASASERHVCRANAQTAALDGPALVRALSSAGLTQTGEWEREDGCTETRARTVDGRTIKVILDPYSGAILHRADANVNRAIDDRERDDD